MFSGRFAEDEKTVSCSSMKRFGYTTSNIYTLKSNDQTLPRVSYCRMEEHQGYENDMEEFIGYINSYPSPDVVEFSAFQNGDKSFSGESSETPITYNGFHSNHGDNLDLNTGVFKASVSGAYSFSFNGLYDRWYETHVAIKKNGSKVGEIGTSWVKETGLFGYLTYDWILDLEPGDTVQLFVTDGYIHGHSNRYLVFNGQLISK